MELSKIHFSFAEMELMMNAEIILTKNRVLQKINFLLEEVQSRQLLFVEKNNLRMNDQFIVPPKISRGENYLGLPYFILDYPRQSAAGNFFFIRTMFWWGNFFSSTLHLSGTYKEKYQQKIKQAFHLAQEHFIGINNNPWVHHFEETNYKKIGSIKENEFIDLCKKNGHLKIAAKYPLAHWQIAATELYENWKFLLSISGSIS